MLATGRAIVASADPGTQIADVVEGKGLVVPPSDATRFADAVCRLQDDSDLRQALGREGRHYALAHLSRESILRQFEQDLQSLVR